MVVASGGNIAVFSGILAIFAKRMANPLRLFVLIFGIWGYAALAGNGIPIVRAAIMASISTLAEPYFKCDVIPVLFAAGAVMTILDPSLGTSASFLLSFSATLGIATLASGASEAFAFFPKRFSVRETFSATLAATLATVPVSAASFQTFATVSILSNVLVIPLLVFSAVPTVIAMVSESLGLYAAANWIGAIGYGGLVWTNAVSDFASEWRFSSIVLEPFSTGMLAVV